MKHSTGFDSSRKPREAMAGQVVVAFALLTGDWQSLLITPPKTVLKLIFLSASLLLGFAPAAAEAASSCSHASHYGVGDGFHGLRAADGSRFNAHGLTTAHRHLPFGTRLRVINPSNNKTVMVTVTDRGPFVPGRSLDLSYGAFARIASPSQGVTRVCYSVA